MTASSRPPQEQLSLLQSSSGERPATPQFHPQNPNFMVQKSRP